MGMGMGENSTTREPQGVILRTDRPKSRNCEDWVLPRAREELIPVTTNGRDIFPLTEPVFPIFEGGLCVQVSLLLF